MSAESVKAFIGEFKEAGLTKEAMLKAYLVDPKRAFDARPPADPGDDGTREKLTDKFTLKEILKTSANVNNFALTSKGQEIVKALSEGTDSAGGYLTPPGFVAKLIERKQQLITLSPLVTHVPVTTDAGYVPTLATDVTVVLGTENADKTETDAVFGQVDWQLYKFVALSKMSLEVLEDSFMNLEAYIAEKFAEALARKQDEMIAMGTSSSMPTGLYYCSGITAVSAIGTLTYADLIQIEHTVDPRYRKQKGMTWVMNDTNVRRVRLLQDGSGAYIFVRGGMNVGGLPTERGIDTLLGYPIAVNPDLPDGAIIFGELTYYWKFTRGGVKISATKEGGEAFQKDQLWVKCTERYDGNCVLAAAFAKGTGITA